MGNQISLSQLLEHLSLFQDIKETEREALATSSTLVRHLKGEYVFRRGDRANGLYVVITGKIKISIPGANEHEKVIEFFEPGQQFGEAVLFLDHPYLIDAQVLEDSLLICIDSDALLKLMSDNPLVMKRIVTGLAMRFETLLHDISVVNLPSAAARVADYLLRNTRTNEGLALSLPKRTVASKLGLQPETFSRALHQLCEEHAITVEKSNIHILNRQALMEHAPQLDLPIEHINVKCSSHVPPHKLPLVPDWKVPISSKYSECEF